MWFNSAASDMLFVPPRDAQAADLPLTMATTTGAAAGTCGSFTSGASTLTIAPAGAHDTPDCLPSVQFLTISAAVWLECESTGVCA